MSNLTCRKCLATLTFNMKFCGECGEPIKISSDDTSELMEVFFNAPDRLADHLNRFNNKYLKTPKQYDRKKLLKIYEAESFSFHEDDVRLIYKDCLVITDKVMIYPVYPIYFDKLFSVELKEGFLYINRVKTDLPHELPEVVFLSKILLNFIQEDYELRQIKLDKIKDMYRTLLYTNDLLWPQSKIIDHVKKSLNLPFVDPILNILRPPQGFSLRHNHEGLLLTDKYLFDTLEYKKKRSIRGWALWEIHSIKKVTRVGSSMPPQQYKHWIEINGEKVFDCSEGDQFGTLDENPDYLKLFLEVSNRVLKDLSDKSVPSFRISFSEEKEDTPLADIRDESNEHKEVKSVVLNPNNDPSVESKSGSDDGSSGCVVIVCYIFAFLGIFFPPFGWLITAGLLYYAKQISDLDKG